VDRSIARYNHRLGGRRWGRYWNACALRLLTHGAVQSSIRPAIGWNLQLCNQVVNTECARDNKPFELDKSLNIFVCKMANHSRLGDHTRIARLVLQAVLRCIPSLASLHYDPELVQKFHPSSPRINCSSPSIFTPLACSSCRHRLNASELIVPEIKQLSLFQQ